MTMICKQTTAPSPVADDPLHYVLSDETEDRLGDVVSSSGWTLGKNTIALFNHNRDAIVGEWSDLRVEDKRLIGRLKLAEEGTSSIVDSVRKLVKQGILRSVSVGFHNLKDEALPPPKRGRRFLRNELIEASLVSIPANPNAVQIARSLGVPARDEALLFGQARPDGQERALPAVNGKLAKPTPFRGNSMNTPLPQRIEAAQKYIVQLKDQLHELDRKDALDEDDKNVLRELPDRIAQAEAEHEDLCRRERALAPRDGQVIPPERQERSSDRTDMRSDIQRPFAVPKKKLEPLDFLVRSVSAIAMTASRRESLQQVFTSTYGTDEATALVLRAATAPALTTTTGWAAELVETVNAAFMDRLLKDSIYGPLSARGSRFTFGRAGYIKIPSRTATSKLAGAWVGEAAAKPVKQASFTSVTLNPFKLAVISLFSEELGEHSTPAIEAIIRQAMSDDTSEALDGFLIDNVVGSATRPAGLLYNLSTLTPSAAADKTAAMIADVKALRQSIITAGGGRSIVLLLNSEQAMGIDLATTTNGLLFGSVSEGARRFGVDVIVSNTVPADTVIAVNAEDFASATGDVPRYSISDQATVHMEDTTPLPIATGAQGSGVLATPTRSLWQTDTIGVRMTWPVCWAMRRTGMVAFMSGVTW